LCNLKKAFAVDCNIQSILGIDHIALSMNFFSSYNARTGTLHQTCWRLCRERCLATCLPNILIQQIFKIGSITFKARGIGVGQVIRDDVQSSLLCIKTRFGYPH
jgi:hypothetical protein